jgi:hypothetical protein
VAGEGGIGNRMTQMSTPPHTESLRRIKSRESESAQTKVFVTHNSALPAQMVWALQDSRRRVDMFCNRIKQHLRIKQLLRSTENAVATQI